MIQYNHKNSIKQLFIRLLYTFFLMEMALPSRRGLTNEEFRSEKLSVLNRQYFLNQYLPTSGRFVNHYSELKKIGRILFAVNKTYGLSVHSGLV